MQCLSFDYFMWFLTLVPRLFWLSTSSLFFGGGSPIEHYKILLPSRVLQEGISPVDIDISDLAKSLRYWAAVNYAGPNFGGSMWCPPWIDGESKVTSRLGMLGEQPVLFC